MAYAFQIHRFNWVPSGWQQVKNERAKIAAANAQFESSESSFNSGLFSAIDNQLTGSATNTAQEALTRVQAQAAAATGSSSAQVDQAQQLLSETQSSGSQTTATTGSVVDTVA